MDKPYYNAIDYHTLDKNQCVDLGWTIAKQFLELNGLAIPHFTKYDHRASGSYCGMCTYYRNTRNTKVQVWTPAVANISFSPEPGNRQWSYPGYKVDRTGVGVVCHEVGHHVDFLLRASKSTLFCYRGEKVSNYEPCAAEAFAETMRLFILNPCLLHILAPKRCEYLVNTVGLKPLVVEDWDAVLAHAPERYRQAVRNLPFLKIIQEFFR